MPVKKLLQYSIALITALALGGTLQAAPKAPKLAAKAYILQDFHSGAIIAELNADQRVEPASLTKMMSMYVVDKELALGNIKLTDKVKISEKAWRMPGSRMFIEVGSRVSVEELINGVIIQSGNDATIALAEYVAGSEESFASLMNIYAENLGMRSTHFVNATGLPHKDHFTTARDLATLSAAIIREFPDHYALYSQKEYTYNNIKQQNRNRLLWQDKYVDGIKTGHTESAGFCLAASAVRGDMRLISVVLGTRSDSARANESQKLLTFGFRFFETHRLYGAEQVLTNARLYKGEAETIPLGLAEDLYVTIPRGSYKKLKANMSIESHIIAPASEGQTYGTVNLTLNKEPLLQRELIALQSVREGSFFSSLMDEIRLVFK